VAGFRFRAQAALDLRRGDYEAAQRVLARVDAERQQAHVRLEGRERASAQARREADAAAQTPDGARDREWYRFWIIRLDRERAVAHAVLRRHDEAFEAARVACLEARRRYEAIERFREKAYDAYRAGLDAAERKIIDELATQRFSLRATRREGA
jgi:flagellar export protein FliJ